ncbi:MAG: penicillin-binding protein 2 [Candidatus Dadabacteria bacterium]|nr:MAG: penicillin-binding protein 2 [Candidatus Dadabacteria bacterium]
MAVIKKRKKRLPERLGEGAVIPAVRRHRLWVVFSLSLLWVGIVIWRLYSIQIADFETWQNWALRQHFSVVKLASERGPILDRSGQILAVSVPASSIYARPRQIKDKNRVASELSELLGIRRSIILEKLSSSAPFVWIKRQLPRIYAERLKGLKLAGVGSMLESRRFYPYSSAAGVLIGKVGIDGNGLSGIELLYEPRLHKPYHRAKVYRDALGNLIDITPVSSAGVLRLPKGNALQLTIDAEIQAVVDSELELGRKNANAKSAFAVMIDADSGDVLAISQAPQINLNTSIKHSSQVLTNLAVESVFEPGSILKPIVLAAALEERLVSLNSKIDCENGAFRIGRHVIRDVHPEGILSVRDVIVRSSNIGMSKIGAMLGKNLLYSYLRRFGLGEKSSLGLPGESAGILRPPEKWATIDVATHSFGQGVAVTPLQIVRAVAAIANGGKLPRLNLLMRENNIELKPVISEGTAEKVRQAMLAVVEDPHGTGKRAAIDGILIGGKTGTAQKPVKNGRGYQPGAYIASFVGFADGANAGINRRLVLLVSIDEPDTDSIYGGILAAPVFKRIIKKSLYILATRKELKTPGNKDNLVLASYHAGA